MGIFTDLWNRVNGMWQVDVAVDTYWTTSCPWDITTHIQDSSPLPREGLDGTRGLWENSCISQSRNLSWRMLGCYLDDHKRQSSTISGRRCPLRRHTKTTPNSRCICRLIDGGGCLNFWFWASGPWGSVCPPWRCQIHAAGQSLSRNRNAPVGSSFFSFLLLSSSSSGMLVCDGILMHFARLMVRLKYGCTQIPSHKSSPIG